MTNTTRLALSSMLWLAACQQAPAAPTGEGPAADTSQPPKAPPASQPPEASPASPAAAAQGRARTLMKKLGAELKARLQAAMAEGGPEAAVRVCADEAQAITARAQADGARAGRASLRLRNPGNAAPPWVQQWLQAQGQRKAEGVQGIDSVQDGQARVLRPIAVEGVCLTCHGAPEAVPPAVRALLHERYPADRATGYAVGDLRGAIWAEVALAE